jgi:hypothetical protein
MTAAGRSVFDRLYREIQLDEPVPESGPWHAMDENGKVVI